MIDSVRQAQKASGVAKVHAVVGGFHLAPAPDEVVAETIAAFREIAIIAVHQAMPRKLVMPSTGPRV